MAFGLRGAVFYGMIALGCAPGTGASNLSTLLMRGNTATSTIMTMFSLALNIVTMPLWLYSLGESLTGKMYGNTWQMYFPWMSLFKFELLLIIPSLITYYITRCSAKVGRIVGIVCRIIGAPLIFANFIIILYANPWLYPLYLNWTYIVCPIVYILTCYLVGFIVPLIIGLPINIAVTMSIQIALQHVSFAIMAGRKILILPDGDVAYVVPMTQVFTMFFPIIIAFPIMHIILKVRESKYALEGRGPKRVLTVSLSNSSIDDTGREGPSNTIINNVSETNSSKTNNNGFTKDLELGVTEADSKYERLDFSNNSEQTADGCTDAESNKKF